MKLLIAIFFALLATSGTGAAQAHVRLAPTAERPAVRPLTRYLAATLHLTPTQATAVQERLRAHPLQAPAPEELVAVLEPVLSYEAQSHLAALQNNATSYQTLFYLTTRH